MRAEARASAAQAEATRGREVPVARRELTRAAREARGLPAAAAPEDLAGGEGGSQGIACPPQTARPTAAVAYPVRARKRTDWPLLAWSSL